MKQMTTLLLGAWVTACGACGGQPSGGNGHVSPGSADKEMAVATTRDAQDLETALAGGDPNKILNQVGWLIASASEIVFLPPSGTISALESPPPDAPRVSPGSASCDANGCVFVRYLYVEPNEGGEFADGAIVIANDASAHTLTLDLTLAAQQALVGPIHVTATWTLTDTGLEGSVHTVLEIPSHDEHFVSFDGVTFSGDQPTGGSLYAKWVSAQFGAHDATVTFP